MQLKRPMVPCAGAQGPFATAAPFRPAAPAAGYANVRSRRSWARAARYTRRSHGHDKANQANDAIDRCSPPRERRDRRVTAKGPCAPAQGYLGRFDCRVERVACPPQSCHCGTRLGPQRADQSSPPGCFCRRRATGRMEPMSRFLAKSCAKCTRFRGTLNVQLSTLKSEKTFRRTDWPGMGSNPRCLLLER